MLATTMPRWLGTAAVATALGGMIAVGLLVRTVAGGVLVVGAAFGILALVVVRRRGWANVERAVLVAAAALTMTIAALSLLARWPTRLLWRPTILAGPPLWIACAGVLAALALATWQARRHRQVARIEAGTVPGWRAQSTEAGVALLVVEGAGYRESSHVAATVPNARARRLGLAGSVLLSTGLATLLFAVASTEPLPPFEVSVLDAEGSSIARIDILDNSSTGTGDHVCVVRSDGHGSCVGYFDDGFAGNVRRLTHEHLADIVGSHYVLTTEGQVFREGTPPSGLAELPHDPVEQIIATPSFGLCARFRNGRVHCVASESAQMQCNFEVPKGGLIPDLDDAVDLAATDRITCAARKTGELRCWSTCDASMRVTLAPVANVAQIVAGADHLCVRLSDGVVKCRQKDDWIVEPGIDATVVAAGFNVTCAVTKRHELWCWGYGVSGSEDDSSPRRMRAAPDVEHLAVGGDHVCFASRGHVQCFGPRS